MAIAASVVLGPRVFTTAGPAGEPVEVLVAAGAPGVPAVLAAPPEPSNPGPTLVPAVAEEPEAPPTTEDVAPATNEVTVEPVEKVSPPTTEAPAPPTTAERPLPATTVPPTTTPPPPPPAEPAPDPAALSATHEDGVHEGMVSWYDLPGSRAGVCAHRTIARGTVVTVTNLDTGQSITCTVDDRGPYSGDAKILDLHKDDFARLAPLEQGVFPARLDW